MFLAIWLDDDRQELPRRSLQFRFDQLCGVAEGFHPVDLFRRKLQTELFFERQHQIQMLYRVPILDGSGRGCCAEARRWNAQNVTGDASDFVERVQAFSFSLHWAK